MIETLPEDSTLEEIVEKLQHLDPGGSGEITTGEDHRRAIRSPRLPLIDWNGWGAAPHGVGQAGEFTGEIAERLVTTY